VMIMLSALSNTVYEYTGQTEILVAMLVANRSRRETERTIGHFLNTVILRFTIEPDMPLRKLLSQVRTLTLEAYANQEIPFQALGPFQKERNLSTDSQLKILLNYQISTFQAQKFSGLTIAPFACELYRSEPELAITTFDIIMKFTQTSTKLTGSV